MGSTSDRGTKIPHAAWCSQKIKKILKIFLIKNTFTTILVFIYITVFDILYELFNTLL